jgi:predicted O-methyltransferase YrrM
MEKPNWNPGTLLGISGQYWKTCTLHAAVKLDIFTTIGDEAMNGKTVAEKIGADTDAVDRLLNALAAMGLVEKKENTYLNVNAVGRFLRKDSKAYLGFMILHHHHLVESWSKLDQAVLTGKPVRTRSSFNDESVREAFLMGMFNNAMLQAPHLVENIDLSAYRNLLDMGGGPGTYAIHFCLQNPQLQAVVFDLPTTRPFAEKTIAQFGLSERISFMAGDYVTEAMQGQHDIVWMSHILHGEGPADCQNMIQKAAKMLTSGGMLLLHDFILDDTRDGPLFPTLFSMNMLLGTPEGRSYTQQELVKMMKQVGLSDIRRTPYRGPTESGILSAKKS